MQFSFHYRHPHTIAGLTAGRVLRGMSGARRITLGQVATPQPSAFSTVAQFAAAGASTTAGILGSLGAVTATGVALGPLTLGISAAVTGLIMIGTLIAKQFQGCGETCVEASNYANQVEAYLKQNLQTYLAAPTHYASLQAAAENNFQTAWQSLVQACGSGALQDTTAGTNCVADRQQGACHYQTSPGGWQQDGSGNWTYVYPGAAGSGQTCWDWFVGYLDPIQNDPTVVPDPTPGSTGSITAAAGSASATTTSTSSSSSSSSSSSPLMPILLAVGLLALLMEVD